MFPLETTGGAIELQGSWLDIGQTTLKKYAHCWMKGIGFNTITNRLKLIHYFLAF